MVEQPKYNYKQVHNNLHTWEQQYGITNKLLHNDKLVNNNKNNYRELYET